MKKAITELRHSFTCCFTSATATTATASTPMVGIKNRLSSTLTDLFKDLNINANGRDDDQDQEDQDSLIDAAASFYRSPSRHRPSSTIVGTIFGPRRGHVTFCVQSDPTVPPPFLFELSDVPTHLLAQEMDSGLLRLALECNRAPHSTTTRSWKAYCNGRRVGYAVRREPSGRDKEMLNKIRSMSAGAGVLAGGGGGGDEVLYMRACYERVVGSRDSVSYHLINPGGSPEQELSVFLVRTG